MNTWNKKYGIFGGSFDPVHNGHRIIASYALDALGLDFLYVIPALNPPHKNSVNAPFEKRFSWLQRSFSGEKRIVISSYEGKKRGISYTIDTVKHYTEVHGTAPYLIIGEDSLRNITSWYKYQELLKEAFIVVYPRFKRTTIKQVLRSLEPYEKKGIVVLNAPLIELSATEIRQRIRMQKSIMGMVPESIVAEVKAFYEKEL
ncbi:nicotinate (nicotinamide) nucleotide adenylyltransferase [Kosmotoga pacifica]|nr:nicotinate (nicotinamide) nucleotide adenylyltransferase [Kosmotoga pacifica]